MASFPRKRGSPDFGAGDDIDPEKRPTRLSACAFAHNADIHRSEVRGLQCCRMLMIAQE
jgi:hypothetical protein